MIYKWHLNNFSTPLLLLIKCCKIQRNNFMHSFNETIIYIFNKLYIELIIYIFNERIIFIQRIIYIFNERIIFIQPIKYTYSTNELNYFYSTK